MADGARQRTGKDTAELLERLRRRLSATGSAGAPVPSTLVVRLTTAGRLLAGEGRHPGADPVAVKLGRAALLLADAAASDECSATAADLLQLRRAAEELERWLERLDSGSDIDGPAAPTPFLHVVVWAEPGLRTEAAVRRLRRSAWTVETVQTADEALGAGERGATLFLCDNAEPANRLQTLLRARGAGGVPAVLLAGGLPPQRETGRALRLGAVGAWCEPYDTEDLAAMAGRRG